LFVTQLEAITRHGILPRHPLYKEGFRFLEVGASEASFLKEVANGVRRRIAFVRIPTKQAITRHGYSAVPPSL